MLQNWKSSNEIKMENIDVYTSLMETRGSPSRVANRTSVVNARNVEKLTMHGSPVQAFKKNRGPKEFLEATQKVQGMNLELDKLKAIQK